MRCVCYHLLSFFCLLCLTQPILLAQTDSLKAGEYYQQAERFLLRGKPEKAIKSFRKAVSTNAELTAAWRGLGIGYELLERYDSTIMQYEKVLTLNPNFSRILYFELGRAYYRNGQYQKALTNFYRFENLQSTPIQVYGFNGEKEQQFEQTYLADLPKI